MNQIIIKPQSKLRMHIIQFLKVFCNSKFSLTYIIHLLFYRKSTILFIVILQGYITIESFNSELFYLLNFYNLIFGIVIGVVICRIRVL